jgi:XTP/dITP diphosphohydrolase
VPEDAGRRFVTASANPDKVAEIAAVLGKAGIELLPRPSEVGEVDETGETLEENARLKAVVLAAATGMPAVADDTGLEVRALGGAPGVRSARYSGEHATYADNVAKLVNEMEEAVDRRARFRTVAMVCWPDGREVSADGWVDGTIAETPRGNAGFGYDPVFVPEGGQRTFAEMSAEEKNAVSHRGRAFRALAEKLTNL